MAEREKNEELDKLLKEINEEVTVEFVQPSKKGMLHLKFDFILRCKFFNIMINMRLLA